MKKHLYKFLVFTLAIFVLLGLVNVNAGFNDMFLTTYLPQDQEVHS